MCIACRGAYEKKQMLRIVKDKDGNISLDFSGKKAGRGAYICDSAQCNITFCSHIERCPLIKAYDFLRDLIGCNRNLPSAPSRKVHGITHNTVAQAVEQA